jgi:hypothetical protein
MAIREATSVKYCDTWADLAGFEGKLPIGDLIFVIDQGCWVFYNVSTNKFEVKESIASEKLYSQGPSELSISDMQLEPGKAVSITSYRYVEGDVTSNTLVHPSILHFPEGIAGGYQYLMVITPFPGANDAYENPCLYVSNDLVTWVVPNGITNPIFDKPATGYNSDTNLYKHTDGYIYLMFRARITGLRNEVYVTRSIDAIVWETPVTIFADTYTTQDWASPSFWHDGSQWVIVAHDISDANFRVRKFVKSGTIMTSWMAITGTVITPTHPNSIKWWHSDIHRLPNGRLIGLALDYVSPAGGSFFLWQSDNNGVNWSVRRFTRGRSYRSCLILRQCDVWMMGVWIDPAGTFTDLQLHRVSTGRKERRRVQASAYALSAYSGNFFDESTALITWADLFTGGAANLAAPWVQVNGASAIARNGSGVAVAATTADSAVVVDTGTIDHSVQAKFATYSGTGSMWLLARYVDTSNYLLIGVADASGSVAIRSVVAGVATTKFTSVNPVLSTPTILRAEIDGQWLRVYIDAAYCIKDLIPAALCAGTKAGLFISGSTANQLDDAFIRPL